MNTMVDFTEHAVKCGIDMRGRKAIATRSALRHWCAVDVLHPETLEVFIPAGWWISLHDVQQCETIGVDYIVVEA